MKASQSSNRKPNAKTFLIRAFFITPKQNFAGIGGSSNVITRIRTAATSERASAQGYQDPARVLVSVNKAGGKRERILTVTRSLPSSSSISLQHLHIDATASLHVCSWLRTVAATRAIIQCLHDDAVWRTAACSECVSAKTTVKRVDKRFATVCVHPTTPSETRQQVAHDGSGIGENHH